jgi:signal transduction histidine kinase
MQEALNNILKHAKATLVHIEFLYKAQALTINVVDNGRGFDPRHLEKSSLSFPSSGLRSMFKRMEYLKGKMEISSRPEKGTQLTLSLPIPI